MQIFHPALWLVLGLILLSFSTSMAQQDSAEMEPPEDVVTFAILNIQGEKTRGTLMVNGVSVFNESTFTWSLEGIVAEYEGMENHRILAQEEGVEFTLEFLENGIWGWRFSIDLNLYDRCSCVLKVAQINEQREELGSDNLALFIGEAGTSMTQIGWLIDESPLMSSGSLHFEAAIFEDPENSKNFHASISPYGPDEVDNLGQALVSGILLEMVQLEEGGFNFEINHLTNLTIDGYYRFSVYSAAAVVPVEIVGIDFYLDLTPPKVNISCPDEIAEGTEELLVDGTHSTDVGSQDDLVYSWTIEYPDGHLSAPDADMLVQPALLQFIPVESGQYNLTLRVVDLAGHVAEATHRLIVINQVPHATLMADGLSRSAGDVIITDSNSDSIFFDASNSSDTSNDIDALQYAWYLDGLLVSSESTIQLRIADLPAESVLELIVKDDEGSSDVISIVLVNTYEGQLMLEERANRKSSFYTGLNLVLATGLVCVILLLIVRRSTLDEDKLPKWSKRKRR